MPPLLAVGPSGGGRGWDRISEDTPPVGLGEGQQAAHDLQQKQMI